MIKSIIESQTDESKTLLHLEALRQIQKIEGSSYTWEEGHSIKYGKYRVRERRIGTGLTQKQINYNNQLTKQASRRTAW